MSRSPESFIIVRGFASLTGDSLSEQLLYRFISVPCGPPRRPAALPRKREDSAESPCHLWAPSYQRSD